MNRNWKDNTRRLLRNSQHAAPEGLLGDIKETMAHRGVVPACGRPATRIVSLRVRRWAAVAATVAVAVGVGVGLLPHRPQTGVQPVAQTALREAAATGSSPRGLLAATEPAVDAAGVKVVAAWEASRTARAAAPESMAPSLVAVTACPSVDAAETAVADEASLPSGQTNGVQNEAAASAERQGTAGAQPTASQRLTAFASGAEETAANVRPSAGRGIEVGASLSGMPGSNVGRSAGQQYVVSSDASPFGPADGMSADAVIPGLEHADPVAARAKHHQPFKVGLSLRVPVGRRWNIQAGLDYAYLKSEFEDVGYGTSMTATQTLHYMGIPLGLSYDVLCGRRFNVYGTVGGEVQKLVKGTCATEQAERKVKEGRPVWSVGATVGAAYKLSETVGVYVEPGVDYHFKNGSGVESAYTHRPLGFSLNVGLRLNVK